jgi:hypothetical protein
MPAHMIIDMDGRIFKNYFLVPQEYYTMSRMATRQYVSIQAVTTYDMLLPVGGARRGGLHWPGTGKLVEPSKAGKPVETVKVEEI